MDRSNDRSSHNRYENKRDYTSNDRTPVVKERNGSDNRSRSMVNKPVQRETKQIVDRKPEMKRNEHVFTNRSEVRNKPVVAERSSTRNERSETVHMNRGSQQREMKSFDKPQRSRSVSEVNRSHGNGNERGNGNGNGNERSNGNGRGNGKKH